MIAFIWDENNEPIQVTNLFGADITRSTLSCLPCGTVGNEPDGEVVLKVSIREGTINATIDEVGLAAGSTVAISQTTPGTTNNVTVKGATTGLITKIATGANQINGSTSLAARAGRTSVLIRNVTGSPETCYFGYTTGVTALNGMPLAAGESVAVQNTAEIFFFSAGGTADIRCAEDYYA